MNPNAIDTEASQLETCRKYGVQCLPSELNLKLGISDNFFSGELPLNGLRHPPEADTCGWYLWAGETLTDASDFFKTASRFSFSRPKPINHAVSWFAAGLAVSRGGRLRGCVV